MASLYKYLTGGFTHPTGVYKTIKNRFSGLSVGCRVHCVHVPYLPFEKQTNKKEKKKNIAKASPLHI